MTGTWPPSDLTVAPMIHPEAFLPPGVWHFQTSVKAGFLAIEKRRSNSVEICLVR